MDSRLCSPDDRTRNLEARVNDLLESNRQKEKSNRALQRQISKLQVELQESQVKSISKSRSKQLVLFIELLIAGFALSLGAMSAVGWIFWLNEMING